MPWPRQDNGALIMGASAGSVIYSLLAISLGASLGAISRWLLGLALNAIYPLIPLGTLAANWLGCYIIGLASSIFAFLDLPASSHLRLLVITGFLGSLTTFSTFTAEMCALLRNEDYRAALAGIGLHVGGSLIMFFLGIGTFILFQHAK